MEVIVKNKINQLVEAEGLTRYAFAAKYGLCTSQMYVWKRNLYKTPSVAAIAQIMMIGGYSFDDIIEYEMSEQEGIPEPKLMKIHDEPVEEKEAEVIKPPESKEAKVKTTISLGGSVETTSTTPRLI